jgi:hypothetical protein
MSDKHIQHFLCVLQCNSDRRVAGGTGRAGVGSMNTSLVLVRGKSKNGPWWTM